MPFLPPLIILYLLLFLNVYLLADNTNIVFQRKCEGAASCDVTPFKYICYTLEVTNLNDAP